MLVWSIYDNFVISNNYLDCLHVVLRSKVVHSSLLLEFRYINAVVGAGTYTPSDEYDSYREYRVANTNMYSRIHFFSDAKLGNGLSVLVYACTMYSAQKFHFANPIAIVYLI